MMHEFIMWLVDLFYKTEKEGKDGYILIKFSVPMDCLWKLYEKLIKVDVPPIETIPTEEKLKYWTIAKKYHESEEQAIKASKAAYVLTLITNS